MPFFAGHTAPALVCYAAHSAPAGASRVPEGSATLHTTVCHLFQALAGHTVKAVATYHKLVGTVPEKPATSRLFNALFLYADSCAAPIRSSAARAAHRGQARSHICFGPITPVPPTGTALLAWRCISVEADRVWRSISVEADRVWRSISEEADRVWRCISVGADATQPVSSHAPRRSLLASQE